MTTKLLTAGEYEIPDEHTVVRQGNTLIVRPKIKYHNPVKYHCRDCRFLGRGRTAKNFSADVSCCLKRQKATGLYYSAYPSDKACYEFENRVEPRGC